MKYIIKDVLNKKAHKNEYALTIEFMHGDGDDYDINTEYAESAND